MVSGHCPVIMTMQCGGWLLVTGEVLLLHSIVQNILQFQSGRARGRSHGQCYVRTVRVTVMGSSTLLLWHVGSISLSMLDTILN